VNAPDDNFCRKCRAPTVSVAAPSTRFAAPEAYTPKHLAEKILTSKAALEGERKQVTVPSRARWSCSPTGTPRRPRSSSTRSSSG
jgi:hypothetical protein